MVKAAINGFGRIGRLALRVWLMRSELQEKLDFVAINTSGSMPATGWAHLTRFDTAYGILNEEIAVTEVVNPKEISEENPTIGYFEVIGKKIPILAQRDPEKIPWKKYEVEVVIESTGVFRDLKGAGKHLSAGAKKVVISAPGKGEGIPTYVLGVNKVRGNDQIIDNASCTTNCISPVIAVMKEVFGVEKATMTTIHGYTDDQRLQDGSHDDLRRSRAAAQNIIPTSTGAAIATTKTVPELKGLFDGISLRVPVITGSISDIVCILKKFVTVEEVNEALKAASETPRFKGILAVTTDPLVSSDIKGRSESSIVDLNLTQVVGGNLVKIMTWYDNEWGYCNRLLEQAVAIGNTI
jgi:glyceraldehyde 3-phosphate dehydrogenase